jgi:hypothetical protein
LGQAYSPGKSDELLEWMDNLSIPFDASIISVDMLLFGGLVASRRADIPFEAVQERFRKMISILKDKKSVFGKIYLFKTIMRAAPTYTDESLVPVIGKLVELSCRMYQSDKDLSVNVKEIDKLKKEIPGDLLENYLKARRRNHEINKYLLELMEDEISDFLLFGIDDSKTTGLNIREKEELESSIDLKNLGSRVMIAPGTDESALLLLARSLNSITGKSPEFFPIYSNPKGKGIIPIYEDRSFEDIIKLHVRVTGAEIASSREDADILLFAHIPPDNQKEAANQSIHLKGNKLLKQMVREMKDYMDKGKRVALVDAFYANGADTSLMCDLVCKLNIANLKSFAAWNTAGNSIGTSVAHASVLFSSEQTVRSPEEEEKAAIAHLSLLVERFADDWLYQSEIRQQASAQAILRRVSVFHLDQWSEHFEKLVRDKMSSRVGSFFDKYLRGTNITGILGRIFSIEGMEIKSIKLPWDRLFEVDIEAEFNLVSSIASFSSSLINKDEFIEVCRRDCICED